MDKTVSKDKQLIRELAKQVAEIAGLPVQNETKKLCKALNARKPVRPMVMIDQIPWHEMDIDGELTLQCNDPFCRKIESQLREILYKWRHIRADMVVEPYFNISKVICGANYGIKVIETKAVTDANNDVFSHIYHDQLKTEEDLCKLKMPEVYLDEEATAKVREKAEDLLDGILEVRMQGYFPNFAAWDRIAEYRGVENILYDLIDRPEFLHQIMSRFTDISLSMLDQLEAKGLLGYGQSTVHCTGAYADELPAPGFNPQQPRAKDLWTFGMAQMFSTISPAMHNEFDIEYAVKWYSRFGLVYYGCCEPLDKKMDIVRKIPNLRKISMSPWVDVEKGAEQIGRDYVFSRKPSPAVLATDSWDIGLARKELENVMRACSRYECPLEFILKDISTVKYQPQRLWEWAKMAMETVN